MTVPGRLAVPERAEEEQHNPAGFPLGHLIAVHVDGRTDEDLSIEIHSITIVFY